MNRTDERRKWHIDKSLNVGYLLTTVLMLASIIYSWHVMDLRIALLEQSQDAVVRSSVGYEQRQAIRDDRQDADYAREISEIKEALREIAQNISSLRSNGK